VTAAPYSRRPRHLPEAGGSPTLLLEPSRRASERTTFDMVVLHVKWTTSSPSPSPSPEAEFLHECAATAAVADVAAALAGTAGLQARVLSLCRRLRGERNFSAPRRVTRRSRGLVTDRIRLTRASPLQSGARTRPRRTGSSRGLCRRPRPTHPR
jgi:hypothetical protein